MTQTSTLTHTSTTCSTSPLHSRSHTSAPSDTISRRLLFFCLSLLIVAGSYTGSMAQCPGSSPTGLGLGAETNPGSQATCTCASTWATAALCGSGATVTVTVAAHTYYNFEYSGGQNTNDLNVNGTAETSPYNNWGSGTSTSLTLGTNRGTAITCGSWSGSSATLSYQYSTPTVSLTGGTGYNATASVCVGATSGYTISTTNVDGSNSAAYSWTVSSGTATIANATTATPTVTFTTAGSVVIKCTVANGTCSASASTSTITVYAAQTMSLTGGVASPSICVGTALGTSTVYTFGGGATSASITSGSLPAGMTGVVSGSTFVISGTPTAVGSFPYAVTSSGAGSCSPVSLSGTITVNNTQSMSLTGGVASPSICVGTALGTSTVYTFGGGATSASITSGSLPAGMTGAVSGSTFVISGTPTAVGSFPYAVTSSGAGSCSPVSLSGTITVNNTQSMSLTGGVASPSLCQNTTLGTNTVYTIGGGATSASITSGTLPTGMSGVFSGSTFTISGTPSVAGSFPYTVTTSGTGGCSPVSLSGTITVNPIQAITLTTGNSSQSVCSGVAIATISYTLSGGATSASVSGLPAGLTDNLSGTTYTITGAPTVASGSYPFTVTTSGTCATATATGTITVNPNQTITLTSAAGSDNQAEFCEGTPLPINIVYTLGGGATGASTIGLPAGITGSLSGLTYTISGTPTVSGSYTYFVETSGSCSGTVASGTITISPTNQATVSGATSANVCAATNPTYTVPSSDYSSSGGTVLWTYSSTSGTPGSITSGATGYTPTYTFSPDEVANGATITLTMTVSNAYCSNATATFTINAYGATGATAGSTTSATVCAATSGSYTVPSGYAATNGTILWTPSSTSGSPGSITAGASTTTPTYTFSANEIANGATITLTMTVSNPGCSSSTQTFVINAYGAPTATASGITSANVCAATNPYYTVPSSDYSSTNGTVLWTYSSTSGTPGSITAGATGYTPTYTFSPDEVANGATITLTMTVSNAGCSSATKTFTINAYPATTATPGSTTSAIVCAATSGTYTVPSGYAETNGTILWTSSSTSGSPGSITAGATSTTPTYTFSANEIANGATITLTMTVSNAGGCTSSTTFTINAYGAPTATAGSTTSAIVCAATNSTYTVPTGYSSTNGTVLWTFSSTSATPGSITSGATGYTPTYAFSSDEITNGATITLTMTVSNAGCSSATTSFIISAYPATAATAGSTTTATVCSSTNSYTVPSGYSSGTGSSVSWSASSTSGSTGTISGGTSYTPTYTFSSADKTSATTVTVTLTMTASNGGCSSSTATFTLTISPTPQLSDQTYAVCGSVSFTYTPSGGVIPSGTSYSWSAPTGTGFTDSTGSGSGSAIQDNLASTTTSPATATYSVTPTAGSCTGAPFNVVVTVNPAPSLASITSVIDPCNGGYASSIAITGGASPYMFELTPPGVYYTVYAADTEMDGQGASTVSLSHVTDANGCAAGSITGSPITFGARALTTGDSADCIVTSGATKIFYDHSGNLMATLSPASSLGSTGIITTIDGSVQETTETHDQHYLQRHYQILPTNANVSTNVCLFLTDAEANALSTASAGDLHTSPAFYGTFPSASSSAATFQAGTNIVKYDGASETPSSHSSRSVISSITATHNPTIENYTYNNVWELCFNVGSFSGFYIYAANSTGDPLPVTLVSFTAEAVNNQYISLDWVTASEVNNSGFQIERSLDGVVYQSIGWVDGHGNSEVTNDYQFSDLTAIPGVVYYYRLKQVDFDGNYAYSQIASAELTGDKGFTLQGIYPNPATNEVTIGIISNLNTAASVTITDMLGRNVMLQDWTLSVGYNTNVYDLTDIAAGTYIVTVSSGAVKTSKQLVITK